MSPPSPFVGPHSLQCGQPLFGRDAEAANLIDLLIAERIVLLYARSGAGKSSLLEAKVRAHLDCGLAAPPDADAAEPMIDVGQRDRLGFRVLPTIRVNWRHGLAAPNALVASLGACLAPGLDGSEPVQGVLDGIRSALDARRGPNGTRFLFLFDQFEEVLISGPDDDDALRQRFQFFQALAQLLKDPANAAIFAMREDYLAGLDPYLPYVPTHLAARFRLELLTTSTAQDVVSRLTAQGGHRFGDDACRLLIEELSKTRGVQDRSGKVGAPGRFVEPVQLQVVGKQVWEKLGDRLEDPAPIAAREIEPYLSQIDDALAAYCDSHIEEAAVAGAVGDTREARTALERLLYAREASATPEGRISRGDDVSVALQRTLRWWLEGKLVNPTTGVRNRVQDTPFPGAPFDAAIVKSLENSYVIRRDRLSGVEWYELAHDRLIAPLQSANRAWRARHLQPWQQRTEQWLARGKPESLLLGYWEARAGRRLRARRPRSVTSLDLRFLAASQRRAILNVRTMAMGFLIFSPLAFAMLSAVRFYREQARQLTKANRALDAEVAKGKLLAESLADEVKRRTQKTEQAEASKEQAEASKAEAEIKARALAASLLKEARTTAELSSALREKDDAVVQLQASVRAQEKALVEKERAVVGELLLRVVNQASAADADLPRSLLQLVEAWKWAGTDNQAFLLPALRRALEREPALERFLWPRHRSTTAIAVDRSRRWLASGGPSESGGGLVELWDLPLPSAGQPTTRAVALPRAPMQLAFHPHRELLVAVVDGRAHLWDLRRNAGLLALPAGVLSVAFSPDGSWLAAGSRTGDVLLARVAEDDVSSVERVGRHTGSVRSVAFSPDSEFLASGGWASETRLWRLRDRVPRFALDRNQGVIRDLVLISPPDAGLRVLAAGWDGSIRVWDPLSRESASAAISSVPLHPRRGEAAESGDTSLERGLSASLLNVRGLTLSGDAEQVAVAASPGLLVWSTKDLGRTSTRGQPPVSRLTRGSWSLRGLAFLEPGVLAVGGEGEPLALWRTGQRPALPARFEDLAPIACHIANRQLSAQEWNSTFGGLSDLKKLPHVRGAQPGRTCPAEVR